MAEVEKTATLDIIANKEATSQKTRTFYLPPQGEKVELTAENRSGVYNTIKEQVQTQVAAYNPRTAEMDLFLANFAEATWIVLPVKEDKNDKESKDGFEGWLKENTKHLVLLQQGFWIEDKCIDEPKCGCCGQYLILKKTAEQQFVNLEQAGLMKYATEYVFGKNRESDTAKMEKRFHVFWAFSQSEYFRNILESIRIEKELEKWLIYKDFGKIVNEKFTQLYNKEVDWE